MVERPGRPLSSSFGSGWPHSTTLKTVIEVLLDPSLPFPPLPPPPHDAGGETLFTVRHTFVRRLTRGNLWKACGNLPDLEDVYTYTRGLGVCNQIYGGIQGSGIGADSVLIMNVLFERVLKVLEV